MADPTTENPPCPASEAIVRYTLGILEGEDRAIVDRHLSTCADCRMEVRAPRKALDASFGPKS